GADPAGPFLAVAELRDLDRRQGDADEVLTLLADHLAAADVLGEVRLHLAADELVEPLAVALDLLAHICSLGSTASGRVVDPGIGAGRIRIERLDSNNVVVGDEGRPPGSAIRSGNADDDFRQRRHYESGMANFVNRPVRATNAKRLERLSPRPF